MCRGCDGLCHVWEPGAPTYGCVIRLGDRVPGEIVILGTGQRCRILWHTPKGKPHEREVTFVAMIDDFDDHESSEMIPTSSDLGVRSVGVVVPDTDDGGRADDLVDPMIRGRHRNELL